MSNQFGFFFLSKPLSTRKLILQHTAEEEALYSLPSLNSLWQMIRLNILNKKLQLTKRLPFSKFLGWILQIQNLRNRHRKKTLIPCSYSLEQEQVHTELSITKGIRTKKCKTEQPPYPPKKLLGEHTKKLALLNTPFLCHSVA